MVFVPCVAVCTGVIAHAKQAPSAIAVYEETDLDHYKSLGEVASASGGKNEVLVPQLGRLYVTIPPQATAAGEVYVYQVM